MILHVRHNCSIILNINNLSRTRNIASLPCEIVLGDLTQLLKSFFSSGVFRRETASGFYPWGNVVIPRERVAEGLCGLAAWELVSNDANPHNPYAKCEAFHIAPRLFFMFLFLIPFTIQQQCIIYSQKFPNEPLLGVWGGKDFMDWAIFWIC